MTKDDGLTSSSDVVIVGFPIASSSACEVPLIGFPQNSIAKTEVVEDVTDGDGATAMIPTTSSVRTEHATLQSLLAAPITTAQVVGHPDTIQIITVPNASDLITTSQPDGMGRVWQVVPSVTNPEIATIIAVSDPHELIQAKPGNQDGAGQLDGQDQLGTGEIATVSSSDTVASILMPPPTTIPSLPLPPNCPSWAVRLKNCERIGDSYRGYVESEVELDLLLTFHKQQTQSFWGTRQSPSPAKPSTRLMWKSQYVPFDGIPFVNAGSRAVVMECQYGPRRKGNPSKKVMDIPIKGEYKQTCPARIYIKRVRKFPEYYVDINLDKKSLKAAMDKAFQELKDRGVEGWGQERYYVQLPTEKAHEFHEEASTPTPIKYIVPRYDVEEDVGETYDRLHPKVAQKIREMVSGGETRVYAIRKQLRNFVTKELCQGSDMPPERHDLTLFPTVNDLKNHIHQALKDIENGLLPLTASTVNVEIITSQDGSGTSQDPNGDLQNVDPSLWAGATIAPEGPMPETVTVTLTQNPGEDGHHIISRIETHLSDGSTHVSTTLTPESAQLLSRLHPGMFPAGSLLQLAPVQSQPQSQEVAQSQDIIVASAMVEDTDQTGEDMETSQDGDTMEHHPPLQIVDAHSVIQTDDSVGHVDHSQMITVAVAPDEQELVHQLESPPHTEI